MVILEKTRAKEVSESMVFFVEMEDARVWHTYRPSQHRNLKSRLKMELVAKRNIVKTHGCQASFQPFSRPVQGGKTQI